MALLRAVGPTGQVTSYEIREDFAQMGQDNIAAYYGPAPNWTVKVKDITTELDETNVDRIVLDLPNPWDVTEKAWQALCPGGICMSYLPTVLQIKGWVDSLKEHGGFACIETMETLIRFWHIKDLSARPEHRMIGHTGFITVARRLKEIQTRDGIRIS
jgi:tRNA (adenine57-N1/adenine58-N1)-methyltransferase